MVELKSLILKILSCQKLTWTTFHGEPRRSRVYNTRFFKTQITRTRFLNEQNLIISNMLSKTWTLSLKRAKSLRHSHSITLLLPTQTLKPQTLTLPETSSSHRRQKTLTHWWPLTQTLSSFRSSLYRRRAPFIGGQKTLTLSFTQVSSTTQLLSFYIFNFLLIYTL